MEAATDGDNASSYNMTLAGNQSGSSSSVASSTAPSQFEIVLQAVILIIVLVVSVVGNGVLCYLVFTIKQLQIPTNYFILSLALADFLFAAMCLPFRIVNILQNYLWTLGLDMCRFWIWLDLLFCSASIANLAAISVDRYLTITSPLTYNIRMTSTRVVLSLAALWGYSICLASLSLSPAKDTPGIVVQNQNCYIDNKIFLTVVFVIGFFAPLATMILMYCFVFKVAVAQAKELSRQAESFHESHRQNSRRKSNRMYPGMIVFEVKATKTLMILLSVFCICWSPFFVLSLVSLHSPRAWDGLPRWFAVLLKSLFVHVLPNCNAAFNPIIYTSYNHQFKKAIKHLFKRCREKRSASLSGSILEPKAVKRPVHHALATNALGRTPTSCLEERSDI